MYEYLIIAIIFFILSYLHIKSLIIIILLVLFVLIYYNNDYIFKNINNNNKDNIKRSYNEFNDILRLLEYTKRYDKSKYIEIENKFHRFSHIYVYVLGDRWDVKMMMPILYELRIDILEVLYSYYMVLPVKMRHVFGFKPLERLKEVIDETDKRLRRMIEIVKLYAKHDKNIIHMDDYSIMPYNMKDNNMLP